MSLAPHSSHSKRPSGSCTAMCFLSCVLMPKCFPHMWHLYLSVKCTEYLCLKNSQHHICDMYFYGEIYLNCYVIQNMMLSYLYISLL